MVYILVKKHTYLPSYNSPYFIEGGYMADDLQNTNIKIASAEDTGQQIKIRDHKRRTYSFFKTKKDGTETAAFRSYHQFKIGDAVEISYKNVPFRDGTIKNILNIRPATAPVEETAEDVRLFQSRGPGRDYWEKRDAKRQSSILMQVAFKAAVSLQAAQVEKGDSENREKLYADTLEFYDWMADQIGDGEQLASQNQQRQNTVTDQLNNEDIGF